MICNLYTTYYTRLCTSLVQHYYFKLFAGWCLVDGIESLMMEFLCLGTKTVYLLVNLTCPHNNFRRAGELLEWCDAGKSWIFLTIDTSTLKHKTTT